MSSITLTEQKAAGSGKIRNTIKLEETGRGTLRLLFNAIYCYQRMDESAGDFSCGVTKSEKWSRDMADHIEDFLKLGGDHLVKVPASAMKIMKDAHKTLGDFKPKGSRKVLVKEFSVLLETLRKVDDLWEVLSDTSSIGGHEINLPEMRKLVVWLRKCRGGFTLRGTSDY